MTRKVLRPVALIGTVAAMFAVPIVLTLSHATVSMSGVGNLKCYGTGGIQKACVRRSGDLLSMNEQAHAVTLEAPAGFATFAATRRASLRLSAQAYIGISERHEKAVKEKPALR